MNVVFRSLNRFADVLAKVLPRLRAMGFYCVSGVRLRKLGRMSKLRGRNAFRFGPGVAIGDFCWIEAVHSYAGRRYEPVLELGENVAISDLTHISCLQRIVLGNDCLLGSKIYIGDHSHGELGNFEMLMTQAPAQRPLGDAADIIIGAKTWIGDGAVILAGTRLAPSSIVAANSVVRLVEDRPALVGGMPARVIRYLDGQ